MVQLVFLLLFLRAATGANILCVFMSPSVSHQIVFQPIWKELSLRGHYVTVLTPNPLNDSTLTNLTEIDLSSSYTILKERDLQSRISKNLPFTTKIRNIYKCMEDVAVAGLSHPSVQALLHDNTRRFDVVLTEFWYPAMNAMSTKFECPLIGVFSLDAPLVIHDAIGNPSHPVFNTGVALSLPGFTDRLYSSLSAAWYRFYYAYSVLPRHDEIARKYISDTIPYVGDIEKNVSIVFVNVNSAIRSVRPNVPGLIELEYMHIKKYEPLPADLQEELDNANQGVVYFSLGSNVKSSRLSEDLRNEITQALSELPYKVLWKWETDHLPNQPKNVIIRKWFPQQDLLGHKNVKVFITQAGLQSMEEAIYNCVPLVAIPFFGDQPLNSAKMANLGIAKVIDFATLTKDELKQAIIEVAENDTFRNAIRKVSELTKDVPMNGLEKAVWWTEYVIRHKGARHLRSPALDLPWYQYLLLDVLGFVLVTLLICIFATYKIIRFSICTLRKITMSNKVKTS